MQPLKLSGNLLTLDVPNAGQPSVQPCPTCPEFAALLEQPVKGQTPLERFVALVSDCKGLHPGLMLKVAIEDLKAVDRDPAFEVDMTSWVRPGYKGDVCYVCLAGSVLVKSLAMPASEYEPDIWGSSSLSSVDKIAFALNALRADRVTAAYEHLGRPIPPRLDHWRQTNCFWDTVSPPLNEFIPLMEELANELLHEDPPC